MFQNSLQAERLQMIGMGAAANFDTEAGDMMMMSGANTQPQPFHFEGCPQAQILMRQPTMMMYHQSQEANVGFDGEMINIEENNNNIVEEEDDIEVENDQIIPHQASPTSFSGDVNSFPQHSVHPFLAGS